MLLGAIFIGFSYMLLRTKQRSWALRTYLFSLLYLALLFVSMAIAAHV
jgi:heme O synthase-like polyprenyltransferase